LPRERRSRPAYLGAGSGRRGGDGLAYAHDARSLGARAERPAWQCERDHGRGRRGLGAALALVPVVGPGGEDSEFFLAELRTHARENGLYVCVANKIGIETATGEEVPSHGDTCVLAPTGEVLAHRSGEAGCGFVRATLDLGFLTQTRQRLPFYEQRRSDLINLGRKQ
jgi:predicted amidohydrolase